TRLKDIVASRGSAPAALHAAIDADMLRRLASLGYIGSVGTAAKRTFTAADDPKNLVGLNEAFYGAIKNQIDGRSEAAVATLRDIVAKRPDFLAARMSAAAVLGASDRAPEAIALLQAAPEDVASAPVQTELGLAYEAV